MRNSPERGSGNRPLLKEEYNIDSTDRHLLIRSFQKRTPAITEATDSRKKEEKPNVLKMLHHVCLIPFCIIDMNLVCFIRN